MLWDLGGQHLFYKGTILIICFIEHKKAYFVTIGRGFFLKLEERISSSRKRWF
jgi:hypothetical protein